MNGKIGKPNLSVLPTFNIDYIQIIIREFSLLLCR